MSFTFYADLPANRDWVRLLTGDTNPADPGLDDETIDAIIAESVAKNGSGAWTKYFAAVIAGGVASAHWESTSSGLTEKKVGDLTLRFGDGSGSASEDYRGYLDGLQRRGAELLLLAGRRPALFKVL